MKYITIDIDDGMNKYQKGLIAGVQGESYVRGVKFVLPEAYSGWTVFVDLKNANQEKYRYEVADVINNVATYDFTAIDLKYKGILRVDLVLTNGRSVFKPFVGEFRVQDAVCADDYVVAKYPVILTSDIAQMIQDHDTKITALENRAVGKDWAQNDPEAADYIRNRTHYDAGSVHFPANGTWDHDDSVEPNFEFDVKCYRIGNALSQGDISKLSADDIEVEFWGAQTESGSASELGYTTSIIDDGHTGSIELNMGDGNTAQVAINIVEDIQIEGFFIESGLYFVVNEIEGDNGQDSTYFSAVRISIPNIKQLDAKYIPATVSPTISVSQITGTPGGYKLTITNRGETEEVVINNGAPGSSGSTPERGVDYWTQNDKLIIVNELKSYCENLIVNGEW